MRDCTLKKKKIKSLGLVGRISFLSQDSLCVLWTPHVFRDEGWERARGLLCFQSPLKAKVRTYQKINEKFLFNFII